MSRYNTVLYNWMEVTNRLLHDKQLLVHFLRFSAGMYKQSFSDAALIYKEKKAMKKKYVRPEIEVIEFDTEDVITTSPTNPDPGNNGTPWQT